MSFFIAKTQVSAMLLRDRVVTHADPHGVGNPPTYIRQNGLTKIIQEVIDTSAPAPCSFFQLFQETLNGQCTSTSCF